MYTRNFLSPFFFYTIKKSQKLQKTDFFNPVYLSAFKIRPKRKGKNPIKILLDPSLPFEEINISNGPLIQG